MNKPEDICPECEFDKTQGRELRSSLRHQATLLPPERMLYYFCSTCNLYNRGRYKKKVEKIESIKEELIESVRELKIW